MACHVATVGCAAQSSLRSGLALHSATPLREEFTCRQRKALRPCQSLLSVKCQAGISDECEVVVSRRTTLASLLAVVTATGVEKEAYGAALPPKDDTSAKICNAECETSLDTIPTVTTASGLAYKDIVVGKGPSPPVGFQVAANYVAMVPSGKIFDSSLEKGVPYLFRVGSGQVIPGLDEGILSMKVGGTRRLFIPGELAFPKGLTAAAGRPRVPPSSPVIFDVSLLYIPGLEDEEE